MSYGGYNNPYAQDPLAGNPYSQQAANPYVQASDNPYAQPSTNSYGQPSPYGGGQHPGQDTGRRPQDGIEMMPVNGQAGGSGYAAPTGRDGNAMLNEIREIDRGIDAIERNLERLRMVQQQSLGDPNSSQDSPINRERDRLSEDTMTLYRNFVIRMRTIKSQPESGNPTNASQVGRVDRRLKGAIQQFQTLDSDYRKKLQQQVERELRIVRPDATESEIREAVEDTSNNQVFTQALLQSDRRGQSQRVLQHVTSRHEAIQKIEVQFVELAQLFQDMEALVVQQEPAVTQIEQKGEQVTEDVGKANVEISGAIQKARSRNRKKWWCLLIVLILIAIIVVVVVVVVVVNNNNKGKKVV